MDDEQSAGAVRASIELGARGEDATRLRFDTQDDALDFARKCAEDGRRWARERGFSCANDYLNGRARIDISCRAPSKAHEFKLVAQVIPPVVADPYAFRTYMERPRLPGGVDNHSVTIERYAGDLLVFVRSGKGADAIEQCIPSIVRVEIANEPRQIRVNALAAPLNFVIKVLGCFSEWEVDPTSVAPSKQNSRFYKRLIERVSEIVHSVVDMNSQTGRKTVTEAELDYLLASIRVRVADDVISAALNEGGAKRFELIDACFCPVD